MAPKAVAHVPGSGPYGGFGGTAASCQLTISRAARLCIERAVRASVLCGRAELAQRSCGQSSADVLDAARQQARQMIHDGCTDPDAQNLGYIDVFEAQTDVASTCANQTTALTTLFFGPAMYTGQIEGGRPQRDACVRTVARFGYKLARTTLRERSRALDLAAMGNHPLEATALTQSMGPANAKVDQVKADAAAAIMGFCTPEEFAANYSAFANIDQFLNAVTSRSDCVSYATHVQTAVTCPAPVCGNAVKEPGEECDDGNTNNNDACTTTCTKTSCPTYDNAFDLIQAAIFDNKNCNTVTCHTAADGAVPAGGLDLRPGYSYGNLVDQPSQSSPLKRVEPGTEANSFLWHKLYAGTFGLDSYVATYHQPLAGAPMPSGGQAALTQDELDAVQLWITKGATRDQSDQAIADKLNACLPPSEPIQIRPPDPPAQNEGVQMHMPRVELPPKSENEVCFVSYYDFSDVVPLENQAKRHYCSVSKNLTCGGDGDCPAGETCTEVTTFRFKKKVETQDPVSHHLIISIYRGEATPTDPAWGAWTCKGGAKNGATCDPYDATFCGAGGACGSEPVRSVACLNFGPPDFQDIRNSPPFGGSQQPVSISKWPDGVFEELPIKGLIVWNSHAFNLTTFPGKVEAWVNFDFASQQEQQYPVLGGILDPDFQIFIMDVPAFARNRYCYHYTYPQGSRLFELSSHMHKRGKLFEIYDPSGAKVYQSTQYNDPVQLDFYPPIALDSDDDAQRTYTYCAEYDNGFTTQSEVKRRSTSPIPPPLPGTCIAGSKAGDTCANDADCGDGGSGSCLSFPGPGGPCDIHETRCIGGPKHNQLCNGKNSFCDGTPGDGVCDACPLRGGVTTEDEMFLLISYFYLP